MDILKDKSYKQYDKVSRYSPFPYYYNIEDEKFMYGVTANLKDDIAYTIHVVKHGDTFDSIALKYYNNPTYYWVVADFNKYRDAFIELEDGQKIKVPAFSSLEFN